MDNWQFDPQSNIPLHAQLEAFLKQWIINGNHKPGDRIPSERDLMEMTHLSRATIRQALLSLVHQNILEKAHGSGTYVAYPKYEQPLSRVYSFSEQFRNQGETLIDSLLRQEVEHATESLALRLDIPPGAEIVVIERLRMLRDRPMMISLAYIPLALCPSLASSPIQGSLYRLLSERYGLPITRATDRLEAVSADKEHAARLGVKRGAALMYVERTGYTTGDRLLHLGENFIRGDMCRFSIDLRNTPVTALELKPLDDPFA